MSQPTSRSGRRFGTSRRPQEGIAAFVLAWALLGSASHPQLATAQTIPPCGELCNGPGTAPVITIATVNCGCDTCIQPGDRVCVTATWEDIDTIAGGGPECPAGNHPFPPRFLEGQWGVQPPSGDAEYHPTNWDPLDATRWHSGFAWPVPFGAAPGDYTISVRTNDYHLAPSDCHETGTGPDGTFIASVVVHVVATCSRAHCISVTEPGPGQAAAQAHFTCPQTGPITWTLTENEAGATIDSNGGIHAPLDASGLIVIEAQTSTICAEPKPYLLHARTLTALGPTTQSCGSCDGGDCEAGTGAIHLGSITGRIKLGRTMTGLIAPDLILYGDKISSKLATPFSLYLDDWVGEIEVIRTGSPERIRQIITGDAIVDVVDVSDSSIVKYRLDFYRRAQGAGPGGNGLYALTGSPYVTWTSQFDETNGLSIIRAPVDGDALTHTFTWPPSGNPPFPASCTDERDVQMSVTGLGVVRVEKIWHLCTPSGSILEISEGGQSYVLKKSVQSYPNDRFIRFDEEGSSPDQTSAVRFTATEYYGTDQPAGKPGQVRAVLRQNAGVVWYDYDSLGRLKEERRTFKDDPAMPSYTSPLEIPVPNENCCHRKLFIYGSAADTRPNTIDEYLKGSLIGRTYFAYYTSSPNVSTRVESLVTNPITGSQLQSSFSCVPNHEEMPLEVSSPDGRFDTYERTTGSFTSPPAGEPGTFSGSGTFIRTAVKHMAMVNGDPTLVPFKSTMNVSITDAMRRVLQTETHVCVGGDSWTRVAWTKFIRDNRGRVTDTYKSDATHSIEERNCCHATSETAADGTKTTYEYDALGRVTKETREGADETSYLGMTIAAQGARTTTYKYVGDSWIGETLTVGPNGEQAGAPVRKRTTEYDTVGRPLNELDERQRPAAYIYGTVAAGLGWKITQIDFDGTTRTTEYFLDGRIKRVTGDVIPDYYDYDVTEQGEPFKMHWVGGFSSARWDRTVYDRAGRESRRERPGFGDPSNPPILISTSTYNDRGLLARVINPEMAPTLYEYDEFGTLLRSGLDVDPSDTLVHQSTDRINGQFSQYVNDADGWWLESTRFTYGEGPNFAAIYLGIERDKLLTHTGSFASVHESIDGDGNKTVSTTTINPAGKTVELRIDYTDSTTDELHLTYNGMDVARQSKTGVRSTTEYDILGRVTATTDARTGPTTNVRENIGSGVFAGEKITYTDPANISTISKLEYSSTGRLETTISPADSQFPQGKQTTRRYNTLGQLEAIGGDGVYPVEFEYDEFGARVAMITHRGCGPSTGQGGNGCDGNCGGATTAPERTEWVPDPATGLLTEKVYPNASQTGKVRYGYSQAGNLQYRTYISVLGSSQADTITTSYTYDPATGEVDLISYDDAFATPWNTFTYDRQGRVTMVGDGQGTRTFAYSPGGRLLSETMTGGISKTLTRQYSTASPVGRRAELSTGPEYTTTYGYDTTGRLDHVFGPGLPSGGVHYLYRENSDLVEDTRFEGSGSSVMASAHRSFEDHRDIVTAVENRWQSLPAFSRYTYVTDPLRRRQSVAHTGSAFATETHDRYAYNRRDELASARRYVGIDPNQANAQPIDNQQFTYCYDKIGNRLASTVGGLSPVQTTYTSNDLNQYSQITSGQGPAQDLYYDERGNLLDDGHRLYGWDAENRLISVEPISPAIGDSDVRFAYDYMGRRVRKQVWQFQASGWSASPVLDRKFIYDGWNLIMELDARNSDAVIRRYAWGLDLAGQNADLGVSGLHAAGGIGGLLALDTAVWVSVDPGSEGLQGGGGEASLMVFENDGDVRVLDQAGTPTSQPGTSSIAFSDSEGASGEAAIENPSDPTDGTLSYVKPDGSIIELDFEQSVELGAGQELLFSDGEGTQALLSLTLQPSGPYWYFYNANGDVGQVLYSNGGTLAATYEYDSYGNIMSGWGAFVHGNLFRFSTKAWDDECGHGYWGRRYYAPTLGRWLSRDPIDEWGGANLLGYCNNNPTDHYDLLGMFKPLYHKQITWRALSGRLSDICIEKIVEANVDQDDGAFTNSVPFADPLNHGDNNLVEETIARMQARIRAIAINKVDDCASVRAAIARMGGSDARVAGFVLAFELRRGVR